MNIPVDVGCSDSVHRLYAEKTVRKLKLKLATKNMHDYPFLLAITRSHLALQSTVTQAHGSIYIDFLKGAVAHRRLFGGGRSQLLARAIKLKSNAYPTVLDLTAGLGRDAFVLANLGCDVTMLERHPIIAALLRDGLERAQKAKWFQFLKFKLIETDAQCYLSTLKRSYDIIYVDPMYPVRKKSALVKKEMRLLRNIVGANDDATKLLSLALQKAKHRVVVKRPRLAPPLDGVIPNTTYAGKSSRFDVYFCK
ncbi:class I SAM-dependent methyltransferase [Coxiella endosymbiont of Amblyomma nuttalli]|uniref:class I SAM-dependent methyltransferase n=1 Tax=Coxiella endosymbiont of Amblyomma nuttalli TaxID=2749996 RepID=UPI001BA61C07|nr:class I SAM-dependent methyltransferase [Coxiella endosymbiont of Amblyomma nuttalli]QTS84216.1 Ribosomal RNA small subunit methyltransferase J [Coxiella endosymbiont of Amblyomma nuttalli]